MMWEVVAVGGSLPQVLARRWLLRLDQLEVGYHRITWLLPT
jgi:hypothetical protein